MESIIYTDEMNILQNLYDPDDPPILGNSDSILSVRVNPSGELFFFKLYSNSEGFMRLHLNSN
jgi:hypothetical protein